MDLIIKAKSKGFVVLNPEDYLTLENGDFKDEDFSGKKVRSLSCINSHFENCLFENLKVEDICFGEGKTMSTYINCSFDGSVFYSKVVGKARFMNCTFRNVNIKEFRASDAEFINCIFSGKLKTAIFYGKLLFQNSIESLGRTTNEFVGNDFSQMKIHDVGFRGGIDLSQQKLPKGNDYLYIKHGEYFINQFKERINDFSDPKVKRMAQAILLGMQDDVRGGQKQLFIIREKKWSEIFDVMEQTLNG